MTGRVLVAGVGNIFLGDDGFGVEVARRLATEGLPEWVRVADYGISGLHLAYDLADGYETTILVDATSRGDDPGTVYVIELDPAAQTGETAGPAGLAGPAGRSQLFDGHGMQPDVVLGLLDMLGAGAGRMLLVGCEPASVDYGIGLSPPVTAAVGEAVRVVKDLIAAAGRPDQADSNGPIPADSGLRPAASRPRQTDSNGPVRTGASPGPAASRTPQTDSNGPVRTGASPRPASTSPRPASTSPRPAGGGTR